MNFYFKEKNNYYALDGMSLTHFYLERVIFLEGGDIVYTEDYISLSIIYVLKWTIRQLYGAFKKNFDLTSKGY